MRIVYIDIVDKTASFVARNGPEFEARIMANEASNAKFNFLKPTDPFHAYYLHKVREGVQGATAPATAPATATPTAPGTAPNAAIPGSVPAPNTTAAQPSAADKEQADKERRQRERSKQLLSSFQELLAPKEKPPDFEFIADPPTISALDMYANLL